MSEQNGSGSGSGSGSPASRAIANTTRRPENVTRRGTAKMKFTPTLPPRRKKEESAPETKAEGSSEGTRGRGQGRGRGRGRGDGRGDGSSGAQEMVASGPFALGPALSGSQRRGAPRSNFAPITPLAGPSSSSLSAGLTKTTTPSLKRENENTKLSDDDAYSDPEDGVEIIDIDDVRRMDWMAPESLKKERPHGRKKSAKKELDAKGKGKVKAEPQDAMEIPEEEQVNLANAIDLSESEEEEEMDDLINDFSLEEEMDIDLNTRQEKLFFFQFPEPFPTFLSKVRVDQNSSEDHTNQAASGAKVPGSSGKGKKVVSFAPGVKPPADGEASKTAKLGSDAVKEGAEAILSPPPLDGIIGRLEIRKSGAVQMRLGDGILLDVTAATQPSFLQHAIHLDPEKKRLSVLGEVNRRFIVCPNIEALLESMKLAEQQAAIDIDKIEDGLIVMDATGDE